MSLLNILKGEEPLFRKAGMLLKGEDLSPGNTGEYLIDYTLDHGLYDEEKKLYRNLLVPRQGITDASEIDVLMLHERGSYVFESKYYSGWIFGSEDQRQWTISLNKETKERFYNPVKQNKNHIETLKNALGLPEEAFVSFIVFSEHCELKSVPKNTKSMVICQRNHLVKKVRNSLDSRVFRFNHEQLNEAGRKLDDLSKGSTEDARKEHIEQAKAVAEGKVCPYCGSKLVERHRKSDGGMFVGCSAFPKCKYTRKKW